MMPPISNRPCCGAPSAQAGSRVVSLARIHGPARAAWVSMARVIGVGLPAPRVGVERCRELRVMQNAESISTKLLYYQQQLLYSQHLVSALESCTLSFLQSTLSIMHGTTQSL